MFALDQALSAGATIVTPNHRLAREVVARFDASRLAEGRRAWHAPNVCPWSLWLERLWHAALAARIESSPRSLLGPSLCRELWYSIVSRHDARLLNPRGAARRAMDAWATFHAWREDCERLRRAAPAGSHEDAAVFSRWAERYQERLDALHATDAAQLPDRLAGLAAPSWTAACGAVALHAFLSLTPQQRRLLDALRGAGVTIDALPATSVASSSRRRIACATPRDEIVQALSFARSRLATRAHARIAIVVADLESRRDEVVALAEEILCPEQLLWSQHDAPRPYGVSLGAPLASAPLVASALDLIALACGRVEAGVATSVVRSPFLPDADAKWTTRAEAERDWLDLGQREVDWHDVLLALARRDAQLHHRLGALRPPARTRRSPREWAEAWSEWLAKLGWPGTAALTSAQWQAREAWFQALARFAMTGPVTGTLAPSAALDTLRSMLGDTLFQPEADPAQVQILGVLEAAGLAFDSAWLAGFDARRWPEPVAPNPFLPLAWQQARGVPRAHPDTALARGRELTAALASIAHEVVVSHVQTVDDAPAAVSPLFAPWMPVERVDWPPRARYSDAFPAAAMERWREIAGPPLPAGASMRGGAALFESQSACPFQAFTRYRLEARRWSECPEGLTAAERGIVLHETLRAFWDGVGDHATLVALDASELTARIGIAVASGQARLKPRRWRALAPAVARAEASRLEATLRAWIEEGERPRPPFRVRAHETLIAYEVEGFGVQVRVDRIDELAPGGLAIIDYKSGRVVKPVRWLADRPEGIQLAVYANALEPTVADPLCALAYAQVKAGEIDVAGVVESSALWPALGDDRTPAEWRDVRARLREAVARLAREVRDGAASVTPRDPAKICRHCGLDALCRIQVLDDRASDADAGAGDE